VIGTLPTATTPETAIMTATAPTKYLTVVGSRKNTQYGQQAVENLITGLRGYNITIVSGLAIGIDTFVHQTALSVGLPVLAFPGSGLHPDVLHPKSNYQLTERIIDSGGALISAFDMMQEAAHWTFPVRNQLLAGIADAVLVIEASPNSGSLLTATAAANMNRPVMAVPGSIFSPQSQGTNELIRDGATLVLNSEDILRELNFTVSNAPSTAYERCSTEEKYILDLLSQPVSRGELLRGAVLLSTNVNALLSHMEIKGLITERMGIVYRK
jgi:DNA processing protein